MQPAASVVDGVKLIKGEAGVESMVNEVAFLKKRAQDVPVDQVCCLFFKKRLSLCNANRVFFQAFLPSVFH